MRSNRTIFFLLAASDINGIITHCADLAKELRRKGYNVIFIYGGGRKGTVSDFFSGDSFVVHGVGFSKNLSLRSFAYNISACFKFARLLLRYKPSIVHCHFRSTVPFALLARLFCRTKNLLTIHTHDMPENAVTRFLLPRVNNCIAISSEIEKSLLARKTAGQKVYKIFNGADDSIFRYRTEDEKAELRLRYGLAPHKLTILTTARLVKLKSIDTLIKAIAALSRQDFDKIQCIIVGDGSQLENLKALARSLGIENSITFTGFKRPRDYYALSDIFVLPSKQEGFSVAVVEAMLSGLAILKTPTSGTADQLVDGHNGFVFPFFDHQALAEKIAFLLNNPDILKTMQENSYKKAAAEFTIKKMGNAVASIYGELLQPGLSEPLAINR